MPFQVPGDSELPPVQEPGGKPTVRPGGGGPPGGGPGVSPGGFGSFGGGIRPNPLRGLVGMGENIPVLMRRRGMGPQIPGLTPGPPGKGDTVPAMLTPGEMVMNNGVTQNPDIAGLLAMLNMHGAQRMGGGGAGPSVSQTPQGYATGGVVPEPGMGMEPDMDDGSGRPSLAIRFIRLLMELDGGSPMHMMYGGRVPGYAFGGFVGGNAAGRFFGGPAGSGLKKNAGPAGFGSTGGGDHSAYDPATGRYNQYQQGGLGGSAWADPSGTVRNQQGGVLTYDPRNPWGSMSGSYDPGPVGQVSRLVGQAGQQGVFDPRGNQLLINGMNEAAQGTADALVRRQTAQADLGGLDPAQRAVAKLQALRETGRGVQDIMANTRAQVLGNANDFYQQQFNNLAGAGFGANAADQQRAINDWLQNNQNERQKKGLWGQIAGQVLGAGIGGYASGLGGRGKGVPSTDIAPNNFDPASMRP